MTTLALLAYLAIQHREDIKDTVVDIADSIKDGFKKNNKVSTNKSFSELKLPKEIVRNSPSSIASKEEPSLSDDVIHISLKRTKKKINKFSVIIDGGFACGKHTLANALIGRRITATSICPHPENERIVINFGYDNEKVIIHHKNGTTEEWSLDDYQSTKFKSDYMKGWDYIEYRLKGNDVEKQLQFTLLPSFSYDLFSEEAYVKADAVIYCLNAINFMSAPEQEFFKHRGFGKTNKNVFFAINRWNSIEENEKDSAKRHFEKKLIDVCSDNDGKLNKAFVDEHVFYVDARAAKSLRVDGCVKTIVDGKEFEMHMDIEETGIPTLERALAGLMADKY